MYPCCSFVHGTGTVCLYTLAESPQLAMTSTSDDHDHDHDHPLNPHHHIFRLWPGTQVIPRALPTSQSIRVLTTNRLESSLEIDSSPSTAQAQSLKPLFHPRCIENYKLMLIVIVMLVTVALGKRAGTYETSAYASEVVT